jgi:hypothetical protein
VAGLRRCSTLLAFQVIPQQRQRTIESDRGIAVGHFVAHQLLHAPEGVMHLARHREVHGRLDQLSWVGDLRVAGLR